MGSDTGSVSVPSVRAPVLLVCTPPVGDSQPCGQRCRERARPSSAPDWVALALARAPFPSRAASANVAVSRDRQNRRRAAEITRSLLSPMNA